MGFLALLPALLDTLGPVLQKVLPDAGRRLQVRPELQKALIEQQADLGHTMAEVMKAEPGSESPLARNARPITVLWALAMITRVGVVSPMVGLQVEVVSALKGAPAELWSLLTVGIGVYMLARSVDKFVPQMVGSGG
ncbi:holin family protein [Methylobacterium sp. NMS14P]|uniref:3TM-type holin n=1 Tax=Methylobacterium sp. NMS14P TaxID=2894310 RepID=UPI00235A232D|nr:3TM-type holin [Methylobacterium sp. NMS14P]WCS27750.1 holin family protein [Methylobacterium sp. NMS14P]